MRMESNEQIEDPGDHSVVLRVYLWWQPPTAVPSIMSAKIGSLPLGSVHRLPDGHWELVFSIDRGKTKRQRHFVTVDPEGVRSDCWKLIRLGPGVWDLTPSLLIPGQIHAYVTLLGVPEVGPWIVVP